MRSFIFLVFVLFFYGCNKTSQIDLRSDPNGAKVYDTKTNQYLGRTPVELTYIYDSNPKTPPCEVMRPITVIWGDEDAKVTERSLIVCPNKDYKVFIDQVAFSKAKNYKIVESKEVWSIRPYLGVNMESSQIDFAIASADTLDSVSSTYVYKIGFIDEKNNRLEVNFTTYDFEENELSLYSLDTIIPFYEGQVKPYFKFGVGYHNYEYDLVEYSNINYNLGMGFLSKLSKSIELDVGFSNKRHLNYSSLSKGFGFDGVDGLDSKIDLKSIVMGVNYKF